MSDPASSSTETPHGTGLLPRDFSADELAAAPVLTSIDSLLLDLTEDEDDAFAAALAKWGQPRRAQLEVAIATATVVPVTDAFITTLATTRTICRQIGHPLWEPIHSNDLWVAATALHVQASLVTADHVVDDVPGLSVLPSAGT